MPSERRLYIRYQALHRCLSKAGTYWTTEQLCAYAGQAMRDQLDRPDIPDPSVRTLKTDLQRLREGALGEPAPVVYSKSPKGYYYAESFDPYQGPLTTRDYRRLREAVAVLEQVQGRAPLLKLDDVLFRLRRQLDDPDRDFDRIIRFEVAGIRRGHEHLESLYAFVRDRACIRLSYQAFYQEEPEQLTFTPYLLKSYNRRWFVLGWHHEEQRIETRPLDRIRAIEAAPNRPCDPPARFYESWQANIIGVTRDAATPLDEVIVRIERGLAPYWITKPLHASQRELTDQATETHRVFFLRLYCNYELENQLLGFGELVEVLAPAHLRQKMAERLRAAARSYGEEMP